MTNEEYIEEANKIIRTLTKYGVREETHPTWVRKFAWSNASASWWTWYYAYPPNKPITLDANEFVLPNIPNKVARKLCDHFDALPLFRNSFEYVWKKKEAENPIPNVMIELAPLQHVVRVDDVLIDVCDDCGVPWGQPHREEVEH